ncbi:MAG TPA: transglutaminase-like cysteine peptidase [Beijerinckiaceae bacterium]|nr:transglutaminase-like cysteine peptidase [Beijerinckiaceae bacterium]
MLGNGLTQISRIVFAATLLTCIGGQFATAQQLNSNIAPAGQQTSPPIGWVEFCEREPSDCNVPQTRPSIVSLNEGNWREILRINAAVNREIAPITDMEHHGVVEHWSYPTEGKGDCEDYVLEKRKRLIRAGFPRQALLITVVRDHKGDGHAVLTVKTDRGDFILDNQAPKVLAWSETGYRFIKRQAQDNPNRWVSLGGYDTSTVAGTRN